MKWFVSPTGAHQPSCPESPSSTLNSLSNMAFSTLSTRSTTIVVVVLTTCLVILVFMFPSTRNLRSSIPYRLCRANEWPDGHADFEFGATHLTDDTLFTANRFLLNFSHTMDEKLEGRLLPKKTGLVWTPYNETLRLPIGISMFHAMHCLLFLRAVLQDRLDMTDTFSSVYRSRHGEDLHTHVPHCFSYITQVCAIIFPPLNSPPSLVLT